MSAESSTCKNPDNRPSNLDEEYLYFETSDFFNSISTIPCLVCGTVIKAFEGKRANAIVQCEESADRIVKMLMDRALILSQETGQGNPIIGIAVCVEHKPHLDILIDLVRKTGVINSRIISDLRESRISKEEFVRLVKNEAYRIWGDMRSDRQLHCWCDAWTILCKELGHIPSLGQREVKARKLHEDMKREYELKDWLTAEKNIKGIFSNTER